MQTKRILLTAGAVIAIGLAAPVARAVGFRPLVILDPAGQVHIRQALPCGDDLDITRPIAGGRIDVTPMLIAGDVRQPIALLSLTRLDVFLSPFAVRRECQGLAATVEFVETGLRLISAATVRPEDAGEGRLRFTIPKEQFLISISTSDNVPGLPDTMYKKPSEDVTGLLDLRARTLALQVALTTRLVFRAGCVRKRCIIDEVLDGTQTATILGTILVPGTDTDGDGVPDTSDNCRLVANPAQAPVATPVLTPPPDVTLQSCGDRNIGLAHAVDVCQSRRVVVTNDVPAAFAVGPNIVNWTGNDGIDPVVTARQTVTVAAGADTTPPTVACTAVRPPPGRGFQASATDDCGGRLSLHLGAFALGDGEVIQIQETGRPGVRLLGTIGGNIRHFQVGKGEAVVRATDAAGNVARAACR